MDQAQVVLTDTGSIKPRIGVESATGFFPLMVSLCYFPIFPETAELWVCFVSCEAHLDGASCFRLAKVHKAPGQPQRPLVWL